MQERDSLANALWSLSDRIEAFDERLRAIEQQGVVSLEKHDATNRRLDQLNGSTARNTSDIALLQQQAARREGNVDGRDHGEARIAEKDRRFLMAMAAIAGFAAPAVAIGVALWGS
ncbi:MAG: hypothetical protein AB7R89_06280 [Dehalococcoidia bacterium]